MGNKRYSNCSKFHEANLLKLNCDKALHLLDWRSTWDFDKTVLNTISWYKKLF